jgi:probable HAF family extracellular repeat protein
MSTSSSRSAFGVIPNALPKLAPWCLMLLIAIPVQSQPKYTVTDLGTLGAPICCTAVWGINQHGQAVGSSDPGYGGFSKAFRTAPNAVIKPADNLGGGAYGSDAIAINSLGQVAGEIGVAASEIRGIRAEPNSTYNPADAFPTLGGPESRAYGINDAGQVVGFALDSANNPRAFRTAPNAPFNPATDVLDDWTYNSQAMAINNFGQVVGTFCSVALGCGAFRIEPNKKLTPGDRLNASTAVAINDLGQVTGTSGIHAYRTRPGAPLNAIPEDLGTLGGLESWGQGINSAGDVVGGSTTPDGKLHAFLFTNGRIWDLNDLIPPGSGWVLEHGSAINNAGQIVGNGRYMGASRSFRLDPAPACSLPGVGGASASPNQLWPPNHKFVGVTVNYTVTSACTSTCALSVSSNERAPNQSIVVDAHHVQLLAERDGGGNGRVYTITITCSDSAGSATTAATVLVPHDQGH